jgi:hypothetical protein
MFGSLGRIAWLAILALALGACSTTPKVDVDYDPAFNFSSIRTYHVVDHNITPFAGQQGTTLGEQRITEAIVRELNLRNLRPARPEKADVIVTFHVVSKDKTRVTTYNNHYGYYGYRRGYAYGWGGPTNVDVRQYTEGTMIIDLVLPGENRIIWRGGASAIMRDRTIEEREELINSYVNAIMAEIPGF